MKKTLCIVSLLLAFILSVGTFAVADSKIDLSALSFEELVALKDQINLAIWNSADWQEVTVPQGVWRIGEDIPAGHWSIRTNATSANIVICTALDETGKSPDIWETAFYHAEIINSPNGMFFNPDSDKVEIDLDLKDGTYIIIDLGSVIFTPYSGKPSLGFK